MAEKAPEKFTTKDGKSFTTLTGAENHEELIEAKRNYDCARKMYAKLLWQTQKTADGKPFSLTIMSDYYFLKHGAFGRPYIQTVNFYIHNCDLDDNDQSVILHRETDGHYGSRTMSLHISELYKDKKNAEAALLAKLKEYQGWLADDIATMEKDFQ